MLEMGRKEGEGGGRRESERTRWWKGGVREREREIEEEDGGGSEPDLVQCSPDGSARPLDFWRREGSQRKREGEIGGGGWVEGEVKGESGGVISLPSMPMLGSSTNKIIGCWIQKSMAGSRESGFTEI